MGMKDLLGDRMKRQYEDRTRYMLPRRTNTIIRLDGKAFHTFTRGMQKPFDAGLHTGLLTAAKQLCAEAQGCQFAYVQSDEVSLLLTDYASITTDAWFDGNVQKVCSVAASIFTAEFIAMMGGARFDARVFTIPDPVEVENYFIWRQKDAERNSISSVAQSLYSAKELHEKDCGAMLELIRQSGDDWDNYPLWARRGSVVFKEEYIGPEESRRTRWTSLAAPMFSHEREWIKERLRVV